MRIIKMGVACRGPVPPMPDQLAEQRQVLARHDRGLASRRVPEVMRAQPAELSVGAYRPPARREAVGAPACGVSREQEHIQVAATASSQRASWASSARPSRAGSSASRKLARLFLGFFTIPRQGFEPRSRDPHSSAKNIIARSISKVRFAAPQILVRELPQGRSLLLALDVVGAA